MHLKGYFTYSLQREGLPITWGRWLSPEASISVAAIAKAHAPRTKIVVDTALFLTWEPNRWAGADAHSALDKTFWSNTVWQDLITNYRPTYPPLEIIEQYTGWLTSALESGLTILKLSNINTRTASLLGLSYGPSLREVTIQHAQDIEYSVLEKFIARHPGLQRVDVRHAWGGFCLVGNTTSVGRCAAVKTGDGWAFESLSLCRALSEVDVAPGMMARICQAPLSLTYVHLGGKWNYTEPQLFEVSLLPTFLRYVLSNSYPLSGLFHRRAPSIHVIDQSAVHDACKLRRYHKDEPKRRRRGQYQTRT